MANHPEDSLDEDYAEYMRNRVEAEDDKQANGKIKNLKLTI